LTLANLIFAGLWLLPFGLLVCRSHFPPRFLGVWLIIAGPILNHKHPIADSMYWSNSWAGGVLIALAAASLAAVALRRPARR